MSKRPGWPPRNLAERTRARAATFYTWRGGLGRPEKVQLPFSDDLIRTFSVDSSGVWEVFEDGRVQFAGRSDLLRQIHDLG